MSASPTRSRTRPLNFAGSSLAASGSSQSRGLWKGRIRATLAKRTACWIWRSNISARSPNTRTCLQSSSLWCRRPNPTRTSGAESPKVNSGETRSGQTDPASLACRSSPQVDLRRGSSAMTLGGITPDPKACCEQQVILSLSQRPEPVVEVGDLIPKRHISGKPVAQYGYLIEDNDQEGRQTK